jgi:hypothetical protein
MPDITIMSQSELESWTFAPGSNGRINIVPYTDDDVQIGTQEKRVKIVHTASIKADDVDLGASYPSLISELGSLRARLAASSDLQAAIAYLQTTTTFQVRLSSSTNINGYTRQVRATLNDGMRTNNPWAHIFVRHIKYKFVTTEVDWTTTQLACQEFYNADFNMTEHVNTNGKISFISEMNYVGMVNINLHITISPTLYVNVKDTGRPHVITNRDTYRANPEGTALEIPCSQIRIVTPLSWTTLLA